MKYAYINSQNNILKQQATIKRLLQKHGAITADIWLEFDMKLCYEFIKNHLTEHDTLFISNVDLFKSDPIVESMNVLKLCIDKNIRLVSEESSDKSPMYYICLLNKRMNTRIPMGYARN